MGREVPKEFLDPLLSFIEGDQLTSAAAVASLLLVVALVVIVGLEIVSRRVARHG